VSLDVGGKNYPRSTFYFRKLALKSRYCGRCRARDLAYARIRRIICGNAIDVFVTLEVAIVTEFIIDVQSQQGAAGNAYGETKDIDEREYLVLEDVP
jgi:hypothetical protein